MAGFQAPEKIKIAGKEVNVHFPQEPGMGALHDFLSIFLDDDYKIHNHKGGVDTVIDIGANLGFFSLAARHAFPKATIHSYEPNKALEKYLKPHAEQALFKVHYEAVGLEDDRVKLDFRGETKQTRSQQAASGEIMQVAFRKVIERIGNRVDFLKIDCEGNEWEILEDRETWKKVRFLAMEYHLWANGKDHTDAKKAVEAIGFKVTGQHPIDDYGLIYASNKNWSL
jgi:FkbM family methyltransferase